MSTNFKIHLSENKKTETSFKNILQKIKITEVRQIYIITFWITLVLFIISGTMLLLNFYK